MKEKKIGIINRCLPHGSSQGRESLDLTLAMSAFNESLSLFFIDDGVYQLLDGHNTSDTLQKHYQPLFKMLELYDVENIYVCQDSLWKRELAFSDLIIDVTVVDTQQIKTKLALQDQILSF
ncbi:sulfurtransferase complex subunit TusC [Psychromonas sp. psych-6C06]|uniref:sulfurtransferase complex subunit TusC n=1 Tax=Psychromonas sp. psych-6C06 TaxID=2058089 RepID=UPI000C3408AA|nr:sulfurtransferase complex subunit TusC [Psychromonas sp. psych-6C06]PKF60308.1 sulfurtransferase complex subunit TusC [Psychromonas sp. psych-6C06]